MTKICIIKFLKIKVNKNKLVLSWKIKNKTTKLKRKKKMTAMSEGLQLKK